MKISFDTTKLKEQVGRTPMPGPRKSIVVSINRNVTFASSRGYIPYRVYSFYMPLNRTLTKEHKMRKYGLLNFIFDIVMIGLTAGLWLVWVFVREMRR